jgi:hypothetical protein
MRYVVLAVALCAACSKKQGDATKDKPEPAVAVDAPPAPADDSCAQPCRLLKDATIDAVRTQCPDWSLGKEGAAGCDDIDFARNCIFATYGYAFKKTKYKDAFGAMPWYKPDPAFEDAMMSKQSLDNVAELKGMSIACRAHGEDQISPKTREAVETWFASRKNGVPPLPEKLLGMDAEPITKEQFVKEYLGKDSQLFFKDRWEPIKWVEKRGKAEVVAVGTGVPDPAKCKDEAEMCEGFETIFFVVEDGVIKAIEMFAAG